MDKGSSKKHSLLINKFILENQNKNTRLWKNNVGMACDYDSVKRVIYSLCTQDRANQIFHSIRKIKFGVPGSPDIQGIKKIKITKEMIGKEIGVYCGYEMKTGNAKQSKIQIAFEKMIKKLGGIYEVIRK